MFFPRDFSFPPCAILLSWSFNLNGGRATGGQELVELGKDYHDVMPRLKHVTFPRFLTSAI